MLVLSRRLHEKVLLPDLGITIEVVTLQPGVVRLGIAAPPEVTILRDELVQPEASLTSRPSLYRGHSAQARPIVPR